MPALPEKIRSGLVEVRTSQGLLYVNPSLWERFYLLWTFRNFHRLPQQVLNPRQLRLIEKLCRTSVVARPGPLARTALIGSVENLNVTLASKVQAAASGKLLTMSVPAVPVAKIVGGSKPTPGSRNRALIPPTSLIRFRGKGPRGERISSNTGSETQAQSNKRPPSRLVSSIARNRSAANWVAGGLLLVSAIVLLTISLHLGKERFVRPGVAPQVAAESRPQSLPIPFRAQAANPDAPRSVPKATATTVLRQAELTRPLQRDSRAQSKSLVPDVALSAVETNPVPRPYVAGSPQSGFRYPITTTPNLKGMVRLRAVVGIDGSVTSVDVLSGNPILARAAVRAARHWRYAPRTMNGNPVESETNVVINFLGDDAVSVSFPPAESAMQMPSGVTAN